MITNDQLITALARHIAVQDGVIDALHERFAKIESSQSKPVPADPVPPDRILPPCLRWTKERPNLVKAWRISTDDSFTFYAAKDISTIESPNGWISFAEEAR